MQYDSMFIAELEESAVAMSLLGSAEFILLPGEVSGWLETVWLTCIKLMVVRSDGSQVSI